MRFLRIAGLAGIGFTLVLIVANTFLLSSGFPAPSEAVAPERLAGIFDGSERTLRVASAFLPVAWLLSSIFAAGVFAVQSGRDVRRGDAWSVLGLAGVLLQNLAFTGVEATRLAMTAVESSDTLAGLWVLYNGFFGFNQVFLALALLGFSVSGLKGRMIARWHAAIGLAGAAALLASATTSPLATVNPLSLLGLIGWLLWVVWIAVYSVALLRGRLDPTRVAAD
ncbi:hypothetical protein [Stackebrandtia nassauensis]|uniref:DUF4386 family protein n=1 Tax=Stackebrandtia nassauensis (strain DSM 44728 / CIP 108903 / NRRL B-16338 / NBRC 102104 / LLR-40K-21) TaxID=446470 RepID=D3PX20_STANL|nr:hypothetical protein [Stackebrandtia nassauensis]ADD45244.1 hypothetical protein Snas_5614 [Stackebrandtia nassauensis DSM 44728]